MSEVHDLEFRARVMLAPVEGMRLPLLRQWVNAAESNDTNRAVGVATLGAMLAALPTAEDFARVPVEQPAAPSVRTERDAHGNPIRQRAHASDGAYIGHVLLSGQYEGLCPCESGNGFRHCHGAES